MEIVNRSIMPKNKLAIISEGPNGIEYSCVECSAMFLDKERLEMHLLIHNKEYRFLCGVCGMGLKRKEHLDRHTLGHQEVRPHVCEQCGKGFKRKEHLNIHVSIHTGDKSQVCPLCERSFYRKDHLQKHLQTHNKIFMEQNIYPLNDEELMDVKCEIIEDEDIKPLILTSPADVDCDLKMEVNEEIQNDELESLLEPRATPNDRPYACTLCDKTYKRKDHLKLHSYTHMEKDKICSECGRAFHREEQLLSHMSTHLKANGHRNNDLSRGSPAKPFFKHTDIQILPLDDSLLVPRVSVKAENRPHECPVCQRRFKRKQHLKVHANVHTKPLVQPSIWCSLCNAGFQNNFQFENHHCMTSGVVSGEHYEDEVAQAGSAPLDAKKENNYPPEFIDVSEAENSFHRSVAAEEKHIPTPQRVYVCKYCAKPFKRKDHYKIHLHIHTGIKSFFCPDCGKGFYRKDHLQKHSFVHLKPKPKPKKEMPNLFPITMMPKKNITLPKLPEITITAPSNTKLRVPLQIKVPYQVVMAMDNGEQRSVTIDPQDTGRTQEIF